MKSNVLLPLLGLVVAGFLAPRDAHADQCAWIQPESAQLVPGELPIGSEMVSFCAPCGDSEPGAPEAVTSVEIRPTGEAAYQEVFVNGLPVDLAYSYVSRQDGTDRSFVNLAHLVGCPSQGSPHELDAAGFPVIAAPVIAVPQIIAAPVIAAPPVVVATRKPEATADCVTPIQVEVAPLALTTYLVALSSGLLGAAFVFFIATVRRRRGSDRLGSLSSPRGSCER